MDSRSVWEKKCNFVAIKREICEGVYLDLAGIAIYEHEYYRHLGARASFFVPDDYEQRISDGNTERYNAQLSQYGKVQTEDTRVQSLLDCIHRHHKGYDQEGYISK